LKKEKKNSRSLQMTETLDFKTKWTFRYVLAALGFLLVTIIEGMMLRVQHINPTFTSPDHFYSVMTVHPLLGIYGYSYLAVMGAFYFLIPYLLKIEVYNRKIVVANFWLQSAGVFIIWLSGFLANFNALYTLYWPLPVWFERISNVGTVIFTLGAAIVVVNILLFSYNLFATLIKRKPIAGESQQKIYRFRDYLKATFGLDRFSKAGREASKEEKKLYDTLPVFIVSVARGSVDTVINAFVILSAGVLILVYAVPPLLGLGTMDPHAVDALIYKNWYWWGLDMIADGNVLMYAAGTWYLLIPVLVGRKLFGESIVRTVILVDLLISLGVWSHHLYADTPQPLWMQIMSGQFITAGEIFTIGLSMFASMMTIYLARPIKFTPALKFVLTSIFGFMLGAIAGIIQANHGLNVVLHNTQWVIGMHSHTMLLLGLSSLLFGVVYALIPMMIKREMKSQLLVNLHLIFWIGGTIIMDVAMGSAGLSGMLRRTIYSGGEFNVEMTWAMFGGIGIVLGFLCLAINLVQTLGVNTIFRIIIPKTAPSEA
jgi:cytochrome c oxidase subunit 1